MTTKPSQFNRDKKEYDNLLGVIRSNRAAIKSSKLLGDENRNDRREFIIAKAVLTAERIAKRLDDYAGTHQFSDAVTKLSK